MKALLLSCVIEKQPGSQVKKFTLESEQLFGYSRKV